MKLEDKEFKVKDSDHVEKHDYILSTDKTQCYPMIPNCET